jgi:hypothetical protein
MCGNWYKNFKKMAVYENNRQKKLEIEKISNRHE